MAERTLQVRVSREVSSTSMYKPAPAYCPPNPTSPAAPPFVSSLYPPAYQQADYTLPCHATTTGSVTVSEAAEKPPEYQKLQSKCRAERCFSYGFLFIPIWLWGFLHFWLPFAQRMPAPFQITPRPTLPVCIPTDAILPHPGMPKSTIGPAGRFDSIRQPGISFAPVVDDSWQLHASCTDLEGSQPDMDARWRREEKKWALRCGYALAVWWSAMLVFAVVLVQSGVLRR